MPNLNGIKKEFSSCSSGRTQALSSLQQISIASRMPRRGWMKPNRDCLSRLNIRGLKKAQLLSRSHSVIVRTDITVIYNSHHGSTPLRQALRQAQDGTQDRLLTMIGHPERSRRVIEISADYTITKKKLDIIIRRGGNISVDGIAAAQEICSR
jgi:hypothetical protein